MTAFVGIDPGKKGGIVGMDSSGRCLFAAPLPYCGDVPDAQAINELLPVDCIVYMEKVHAAPGQGVVSMFTFGCGYGFLQGMLSTLGHPYHLITPQAWKKVVLAGTAKDTDAAISYIRRTHPDLPLVPPKCRVPHDGIADAACLALYGLRMR